MIVAHKLDLKTRVTLQFSKADLNLMLFDVELLFGGGIFASKDFDRFENAFMDEEMSRSDERKLLFSNVLVKKHHIENSQT